MEFDVTYPCRICGQQSLRETAEDQPKENYRCAEHKDRPVLNSSTIPSERNRDIEWPLP